MTTTKPADRKGNAPITRMALPTMFAKVGEREFEFVISTPSIATDNASVTTSGINYQRWLDTGAPICWGHDTTEPPVANGQAVRTEGTKLIGRGKFPPAGVSARADEICGLVKSGVINATSIGFVVNKRTPQKDGTWLFDKITIMECSLVSVPALADALITARSDKREGKVLSKTNAGHVTAIIRSAADIAERGQAMLDQLGDDPDDASDDGDGGPERAARAHKARALKVANEAEAREFRRRKAMALKLAASARPAVNRLAPPPTIAARRAAAAALKAKG